MNTHTGQTLSHYRLVQKIGEGGMGVVWKAEDTILGRPVAIKVLPADTSRDEARRQMFLSEARLASSVSDARIAQVFELGHEGDIDFIVMEYVDGKPLGRLLHGRPLPPDKVAGLGLQVAQALARTHRKGLLHRDLKPGNILVTPEGDVKVVDFGLAILCDDPPAGPSSEFPTRTAVGAAVQEEGRADSARAAALAGTLPYMSPEQVRAERLDARSDVFSLGVVLYEMTTGQRPFAGATRHDLAQEIVRSRIKPPHELVPKLPLELDRIVRKALAPARADRYHTMEDLAVDLKRLLRDLETGSSPSYEDLQATVAPGLKTRLMIWRVGAAVTLAGVAVTLWVTAPWRPALVDARTLLILPMEVRGQAEGAEYVGHAFAEAIAMNLAQFADIRILPVPANRPGGPSRDFSPSQTGREAGAGKVLTGALTRQPGVVQASLSLIDVGENRVTWGFQEDAPDGGLPNLAASVAGQVSRQMKAVPPRPSERAASEEGPAPGDASPEKVPAAPAPPASAHPTHLEWFRRELQALPDEAVARVLPDEAAARVLNAYTLILGLPASPAPDGGPAMLRSVGRESSSLEVLRAYGESRKGRAREAIEVYARALARVDLPPAERAFILGLRGETQSLIGNDAAAVADIEKAVRLDPTNDLNYAIFSGILCAAGRNEEAVQRAREAVALNPSSDLNHRLLSLSLARLGRWREAVAPAAEACELDGLQSSCAWHAVVLHGAGQSREARAAASEAAEMRESALGVYGLACYWALAGDRALALRYSRRVLELDGGEEWRLSDEPFLDSLASDPEFQKIQAEARRRQPTARPPASR